MFKEQWLNLLHHEVCKVVVHVLMGHHEGLLLSLFTNCNLAQRIVDSATPEHSYDQSPPPPQSLSADQSIDGPLNTYSELGEAVRKGHLGHAYIICQAILACTHPQVKALLQGEVAKQVFFKLL